MNATEQVLTRPNRQKIILGLLRALGATAVLVGLYFLAPLDRLTGRSLLVSMLVGLLALAAMTAYQMLAILRAAHPRVRAIEALATTVPFFLLMFSATYFLMSNANTDNFSAHGLTRIDSLYFTVTVFATVGFGDIFPASQTARLVVTAQMILNLIVIGLGVRLIAGAVQHARSQPDGGIRN